MHVTKICSQTGSKAGVPPRSHWPLEIYPDMTVREGMWSAEKEGVRLESCQVHAGEGGDLPLGVRLSENG